MNSWMLQLNPQPRCVNTWVASQITTNGEQGKSMELSITTTTSAVGHPRSKCWYMPSGTLIYQASVSFYTSLAVRSLESPNTLQDHTSKPSNVNRRQRFVLISTLFWNIFFNNLWYENIYRIPEYPPRPYQQTKQCKQTSKVCFNINIILIEIFSLIISDMRIYIRMFFL